MARGKVIGGVALVLFLAGCAAYPTYRPPERRAPYAFAASPAGELQHPQDWWTLYNDPVLTSLVSRALAGSLDLQQAASRIGQARDQERITRGAALPQINASGQAATTRLSKNALPSALANLASGAPGQSAGAGLGLPGETFSTYQIGFDASWEIDLFGGRRSANQAAHERTEAAIWSARDAQVILTAEVGNTYLQYRGLQRRLQLADQTLATQREGQSFLAVRVKHGLATDSDAHAQERQIQQSTAQRADLAAQAQARLHALSVLLGLQPNDLASELSAPPPLSSLKVVEIPVGLPSELLQRRPDLRAAERRLAASNADIGVATADLYPKFSLTGSLQLASRSLSSLLESDSLQDNAGARISIPLLDRGRLHATVSLREAQARESALAYRTAVLGALRDVEDALTRLSADRERVQQLASAATSAQEDADTAGVRYRHGLVPASDYLNAQQSWQLASDARVQAEASTFQDLVALYKALGGGWDPDSQKDRSNASDGRGS